MLKPLIRPSEELVNLILSSEAISEIKNESRDWPSWQLSNRQLCDLELLINGGFSPLTGFLGREDYDSVLSTMRLKSGHVWTLPITLDVTKEFAEQLKSGAKIALRDPEGVVLASMQVNDIWEADKPAEAKMIYESTDQKHPGVAHLFNDRNSIYIGGKIEGVQLPRHYDFGSLRLTPTETRAEFSRLGWRKVISFQVRNIIHRTRQEFTLRAAKNIGANLFIHPVVERPEPGDLDHYTRIHCYREAMKYYPQPTVMMGLLPLSTRYAGTREAIWRGIVARNYGCSHFFIDHDLKSIDDDFLGGPFKGPEVDDEIMQQAADELKVEMIPYQPLIYVEDYDAYIPKEKVPENVRALQLSGDELRERLADGRSVPEWYTFKEVTGQLRKAYPPRHKQGFTVFLTGLSGAGKSTIANVLLVKLLQMGDRPVTLLDGDIVRSNLSSELTFSKKHRDINIRRIGFVASEITKNGGIAICAPIAPYSNVRNDIRKVIQKGGGFILVYVSTPLDICEQRDRKGQYAKARAGIIKNYTGISDPYEIPEDADVVIDTTDISPDEAAQEVILHLEQKGYIGVSTG
jgi:sulfate adenylyltransferase